jgi:hypothetical protein
MRVFNKRCGLNVQVVLPVQVKHVTAVLQDNVQGIGGLLLVGVRDHTERQPGGWWCEYPYLFDIYTHSNTQPVGHGIPKTPVSALVRSNHVDADMWMSMRVHLRHNIRSVAHSEQWTVAHKY